MAAFGRRFWLSWRLFLLVLVVVVNVEGTLYRYWCPIANQPVVQVYKDGDRYYFASSDGRNETTNNSNLRRRQRYLDEPQQQQEQQQQQWSGDWDVVTSFVPHSHESHTDEAAGDDKGQHAAVTIERLAQDVDTSTMESLSVRSCQCSAGLQYNGTDYYCILPYSHCGIPSSHWNIDITPGCGYAHESNKAAKTLWYFVLVMYAILLSCMCCTVSGRNAPHFVMGKICPFWNHRLVDKILTQDRKRTSILIRRYCQRRRREMEHEAARREAEAQNAGVEDEEARGGEVLVSQQEGSFEQRPTSLALRTRIYDASKVNHPRECDLADDEAICSICFGPLVDGCRVGALPCDHVFHVNCLKSWLARRNVCPLCQTAHIAEPRCNAAVDELVPTEGDSSIHP